MKPLNIRLWFNNTGKALFISVLFLFNTNLFAEDIEIFGRITAINSDNIELNGLIVFVNANTLFLNHANQPISFSDLSIDNFVEVKMIRLPNSTLLALRIKAEDSRNFSNIIGIAVTVSGSLIQLPSGNYQINSQTVVVDNNFNFININQIASGQLVIVWSLNNGSSGFSSLQIRLLTTNPNTTDESQTLATDFILEQNYLNPLNPSTNIRYSIPRSTEYYSVLQNVTLKIYDMLGNEVAILVYENKPAGVYEIEFNASKDNLTSGICFYRLEAGGKIENKKNAVIAIARSQYPSSK